MKIAIIGGSGKMGRWLARYLQAEGHSVVISGRDPAKLAAAGRDLGVAVADNAGAVRQAETVILSVPIGSFESVVAEIGPLIRPGQMVLDVTSVKTMPVGAMHRYLRAGLVLGTHPLFGPGARGVANQNFVLTPTNEAENTLAAKVKGYLEKRGAHVTLMSPQEHDRMMGVILGLAHFIALVSADTILTLDRLAEMNAISGVTYRVLLTLIESVVSEDPGLYAALQMNLPDMANIEASFVQKAGDWAKLVREKDGAEFMARMKALREGFEKNAADFGNAYENMYRLAEKRDAD